MVADHNPIFDTIDRTECKKISELIINMEKQQTIVNSLLPLTPFWAEKENGNST